MVGWHHRLNGNEFKQALGVREGQGSLAFCSQWSCKESDMTEQLKNNLLFRCSVNPDQGLAFTPQWEFCHLSPAYESAILSHCSAVFHLADDMEEMILLVSVKFLVSLLWI